MSNEPIYYKRSGIFSIPVFFLLLVVAVPLSVVLGVAYGLAVFYVPFVKISFLITAAAGGGLGYLLGKLGVFGKVRSMAALIVLSLFAGALAWYCAWVVWLFALTEFEFLVLSPTALFAFMQLGFDEGFWSMSSGDTALNGYPLLAIWGIEAAIIIGGAILVPYTMLVDRLFCEGCGTWITGLTKFPQREAVADPAALVAELEAVNFESLAGLAPRVSNDDPFTAVEVSCCKACGDLGYLEVKACQLVEGKDGVTVQEKSLVKHLIVPPALTEALASRWNEAVEASDQPMAEAPGAE